MSNHTKTTETQKVSQPQKAQPTPQGEAYAPSLGTALALGFAPPLGPGSGDSDPFSNQRDRLRDTRFPKAQRHAIAKNINHKQGNRHLQHTVNHIQRDLPGGALMKVPYSFTWDHITNIGKYIKITGISFTIAGSVEEMSKTSDPESRTAEMGGKTDSKDAKKDAVQFKVESKKAADDWFSQKVGSFSDNIKPYGTKSTGFSRSDDEASANVAYEHGFDVDPFIFENTQMTAAMEFNLLELKQEKGKTASFEFLQVIPKVAVSGKSENFPLDGMSTNLKGEVGVAFEPDWASLAMLILETPLGWALAAVAGGAAIIYFSMKDMERRQQLGMKIRIGSAKIIRQANAYATQVASGEKKSGTKSEQKGTSQAEGDLSVIVGKKDMTEETYFALVEADNLNKSYYLRAYAKYKTKAFADYDAEVMHEIEAWHDEHWVQSFFSMNYASTDKAAARGLLDQMERSEGQGFLG